MVVCEHKGYNIAKICTANFAELWYTIQKYISNNVVLCVLVDLKLAFFYLCADPMNSASNLRKLNIGNSHTAAILQFINSISRKNNFQNLHITVFTEIWCLHTLLCFHKSKYSRVEGKILVFFIQFRCSIGKSTWS